MQIGLHFWRPARRKEVDGKASARALPSCSAAARGGQERRPLWPGESRGYKLGRKLQRRSVSSGQPAWKINQEEGVKYNRLIPFCERLGRINVRCTVSKGHDNRLCDDLMLGQRLRRWPNIKSSQGRLLVFTVEAQVGVPERMLAEGQYMPLYHTYGVLIQVL